MSTSDCKTLDTLRSFLEERIPVRFLVGTPISSFELIELGHHAEILIPNLLLENWETLCSELEQTQETRTIELTENASLVLIPFFCEGQNCIVASILNGDLPVGQQMLQNSLECWSLQQEHHFSQAALQESAMQLAQSFEEQNWLRGFARNATSFSEFATVNEIAEKILEPLVFLLRAKDVFLIVHPEESECSGLVSTSYGSSGVSVKSIEGLLHQMQFGKNSPPLVRNNVELKLPECTLHSIVAVTISDATHRGFLVAVERSEQFHPNGTPIYDAEFGSVEVGLLEEAAVLLTTQTQNMRLLLQSNELFLGTLRAMSSTIDARDPYTQGHSERVARLSYDLAQILGLSDEACHEIYLSGVLHDIGKIGIPDKVLLKPGKLSDDEFEIIKQHPVIGHRIVQRLGHLQFTLPGVLYHHERWDGGGYPQGLAGQSIPLMARIMAVADAFDAMTSSRPYRIAMPLEKSRSIINDGAKEQWDPEIVHCFNVWLETKFDASKLKVEANSLIPVNAPMEHLVQAVMTLIH